MGLAKSYNTYGPASRPGRRHYGEEGRKCVCCSFIRIQNLCVDWPSIWHDSLLVPAYLCAASAALIVLHLVLLCKPVKKLYALIFPKLQRSTEVLSPEPGQNIQPASFFGQVRAHIALHGGGVIYAYKVARLAGCLMLLGLSIATLVLEETGQIDGMMYSITGKWGKKHPNRRKKHAGFTNAEWVQVALCITTVRLLTGAHRRVLITYQAYSSLLGLVSVSARPRWGRLVSNHLAVVLLALFGRYICLIYGASLTVISQVYISIVIYGLLLHSPSTLLIFLRAGFYGQKRSYYSSSASSSLFSCQDSILRSTQRYGGYL